MLSIIARFCPIVRDYIGFQRSITNDVGVRNYLKFKILYKGGVYWPVHKNSEITHPNNIFVGVNSNAATRSGCYLQGNGGIFIGNYVHFASNIGIISANHDANSQMNHICKEVQIGDYCWIGMNAVILPGVTLGTRTIVGAGAVVTKSFEDGFCVVGGNPAKVIKYLDREKFQPTKFKTEYFGYVSKEKFKSFADKYSLVAK